jgi:hypothetical protein
MIAGHGLLALALGAYVEPAMIRVPAIALVLLLGLREARRQSSQGRLFLHCDLRRDRIALQRGEQPYFYRKYKVYGTRWFAILRLIDKGDYRTLILNPDRFDSASSYHRLRYQLRHLEQSRAA